MLDNVPDRRFFLTVALVALVLAFLPYVAAALFAPAGFFYTGLHSLTPGDFPVYFSYLRQAGDGHPMFLDLFTGEAQTRNIFYPLWTILGLGVAAGASPAFAFQVGRIILIPLLLLVLYQMVREFFPDRSARRFSFLFLLAGSGLGIFAAIGLRGAVAFNPLSGAYEWPMDLWVPEAFTFLTLLHSPHLIASLLLLVLIFRNVWRFSASESWRPAVWAGLSAIGLYAIHPFQAVVVGGVTSAYLFTLWVAERRFPRAEVARTLLVHLLSVPMLLYHVWLFQTDSVAAGRLSQNLLGNPQLLLLFASYGLLLPLAAAGLVSVFANRRQNRAWAFIAVWAIVQFGLFLAPFSFQRRLTEGLHIPLAILAAAALLAITRWIREHHPRILPQAGVSLSRMTPFLFGGIILFGLSNLSVFFNDLSLIIRRSTFLYQPEGFRTTATWLREHSTEESVTLTDPISGNFLPGLSGRRVYLGHSVETLHYSKKANTLQWFWSRGASDDDRLALLLQENIRYLLVTPQTRELGSFEPEGATFIRRVFERGDYILYEVTADK